MRRRSPLGLLEALWRSRDPDRRVVQDVAPVAVQVCEKGEVLWVSDAPADPEFCNNPSVIGAPFLRFYAAAPIKLADGSSPGILAVGGREPKPYDDSETSALSATRAQPSEPTRSARCAKPNTSASCGRI